MSLSNEESQMVFSTKTVIVSSEKMGIYFKGKRGITWGLVFRRCDSGSSYKDTKLEMSLSLSDVLYKSTTYWQRITFLLLLTDELMLRLT